MVRAPRPSGLTYIGPDTVRLIRSMHANGWGYKRTAKRLRITPEVVRNVVTGRTGKGVE